MKRVEVVLVLCLNLCVIKNISGILEVVIRFHPNSFSGEPTCRIAADDGLHEVFIPAILPMMTLYCLYTVPMPAMAFFAWASENFYPPLHCEFHLVSM
jgi:hypothetical protein